MDWTPSVQQTVNPRLARRHLKAPFLLSSLHDPLTSSLRFLIRLFLHRLYCYCTVIACDLFNFVCVLRCLRIENTLLALLTVPLEEAKGKTMAFWHFSDDLDVFTGANFHRNCFVIQNHKQYRNANKRTKSLHN